MGDIFKPRNVLSVEDLMCLEHLGLSKIHGWGINTNHLDFAILNQPTRSVGVYSYEKKPVFVWGI